MGPEGLFWALRLLANWAEYVLVGTQGSSAHEQARTGLPSCHVCMIVNSGVPAKRAEKRPQRAPEERAGNKFPD
jgi:hypothetical protein